MFVIVKKTYNIFNLILKTVCDKCHQWIAPRYVVPTIRTINFIECALGGLLKSKFISKKVKYIWLAYNISSSVIILGSNITYLLITTEMTFTQYIYLILSLEGVLGIWISAYVFFRFSKMAEFGAILEKWHLELNQEQYYDSGLELKLILKLVILPTTLLLAKPLIMVIFCEEDIDWNDIHMYVYPSPVGPWISSAYQFLLVQLLQTITFLPINAVANLTGQLCAAISSEYRFHFDELQKNIKMYSTQTTSAFDLCYKLESKDNVAKTQSKILQRIQEKRRMELNDKFEQNLISCFKRYQKLITSFSYFKYQTEYGFAVVIFMVYPTLLLITRKLVWDYYFDEDLDFKLGGLCIVALSILYSCCSLGRDLQEMGANMHEEIYSVPWYYLEPKTRKIVHIILCGDKKLFKFRAFGVFTAHATIFSRLMVGLYAFMLIQVVFISRK